MAADTPTLDASAVYHAPPQRGLPLVSALVAVAFGVGIFVAFAVFQVQPVEPYLEQNVVDFAPAVKPPPVKQPPPPEKKLKVEDSLKVPVKPDLRVAVPPLELNQLNVKLVPKFETKLAGNFDLNFQTMGSDVASFDVFDLAEVDSPPRCLFAPRPIYPVSLRKAGVSGRVVVCCIVDSAGNACECCIRESSHRAFNSAALSAISKSRFQPATKDGKTVAAWVLVPIRFEAPSR